ncbi:MAG: sugar ABC transporter permease [Clostridiaceae bacterium]|nr:sugar ABC transporter permease [Clostridiaceae bacterium]
MLTIRVSPGYIVLTILSIIWLIPIAWVIMISFREEPGAYTSYFFPKKFTLNNYVVLLTDTSKFHYLKWFGNTLFVSVCSCLLTTLIVLSTSYTLSRLRFPGRKTFMNILLILGMFPGFMSMIAVYYILKGLGITQSLTALIMVYSGGAALSYYVAKGFFDTIPRALDEAAYIDGATKWYVFTRITIPLSKPIIIYTMLVAFIAPWCDYIFASVIMGDKYENYTIALGLYLMLDRTNITKWYTRFAAGAVLVSIPISILFIALQKYYTASITGSVKG